MRKIFRSDNKKNIGDNWLVADFGMDDSNEEYILTTNCVRASEYADYSKGAKGDCELVAELLNLYYNGCLKVIQPQAEKFKETEYCDGCHNEIGELKIMTYCDGISRKYCMSCATSNNLITSS